MISALLTAIRDVGKCTTVVVTSTLLIIAFIITLSHSPNSRLPLVNSPKRWEISFTNAKKRYYSNAKEIIQAGFEKSKDGFYAVTENGIELILAPKYAHTIRNDKRFDFHAYRVHTMLPNVAGLKVFEMDQVGKEIMSYIIRQKLTHQLVDLIEPLSEEASDALQRSWTDNPDWHEINVKSALLEVISQQSARVFLGRSFAHNPTWLALSRSITLHAFSAVRDLRVYPSLLRPLVGWFLPACKVLRGEIAKARTLIEPTVLARQLEKARCVAEGLEPPVYLDTIAWAEECARGRPYDPAVVQLTLALSAMHNTSDFLTQVIYDIVARPGLIEELRKEIIDVRENGGGRELWNKGAVHQLRLMDSVMKESQRLKPTGLVNMRRYATEKMRLSSSDGGGDKDGIPIKKGDLVMISQHNHWDEEIYANAASFDPYRYYQLRKTTTQEHAAHFVATSVNHIGFGHGVHGCPGRFFAAAETKLALCHILMKYELKLVDSPKVFTVGSITSADPVARIAVRRRKEEVQL
ncbi:cytochrome P450 [Aspergillus homomorphus CBS 101889]|uniref:Cytochrome P450 n=1 Tax=Aspergillus homomorphus (strain CBS 101889) TaxID=1450537 RepID=A0A395HX28_ASPHC|nr:cytochrome P450 [Aspergillus homomorphus CBS 101889]RAL12472.1 cytochrome P450 [Aspergillus homomorphus CBS 101889]